jgi:MFS superfamily sulfate permease-like transporter
MTTTTATGSNGGLVPLDPRNLKADAISGFLVFLVALPLCLAIANASCFPPVAGVLTAIVGGLITPFITNSQLTIKGPAAGLIVIVAGCAAAYGWKPNDPVAQLHAYRCTLAVGFAAGLIQIAIALLRAGIISELFPTTVVHGMLAAIGVIIISKQSHVLLGATPTAKEPLQLLMQIPDSIMHGTNPAIALIGIVSMAALMLWPYVRVPGIKKIPGPVVVVGLSVVLSWYLGVQIPHSYQWHGSRFDLSDRFLVSVPANLLRALTFPDFSELFSRTGATWTVMFCLVGSLESVLSAKAVDYLDPWQRRSNLDRDLLAVGVGNLLASAVGGVPMISEIVRSRANIDNGGRTRYANLFHGLFLLLFLAFAPSMIHQIPLTALAAMLVYTGFRLASPRELMHAYELGSDQFLVFASTIVGVLATDLLLGTVIGTSVKLGLHFLRGLSLKALFRPNIQIDERPDKIIVAANDSAVFTTWILLKKRLLALDVGRPVVIDFSLARIVDHTVLAKLQELKLDWQRDGRQLSIMGLDGHKGTSAHPLSFRRLQ